MIKYGVTGFVLLFILRSTVCIPVEDFYPFGDGISTMLPPGEEYEALDEYPLQTEFRFLDSLQSTLSVS